jgi:asparagine synthase (glutamine-hydrolysing)
MLNTLLRDADFMSMSQGLELRVPLIDHQLAKAVLALPGECKLNRTPKKLLVEGLEFPLPDDVVHRPKRGFTLPFEHWMRGELRAEIEPLLTPKRISQGPLRGLVNGEEIGRIWQNFLAGSVSWSRAWSLYVLQRWCQLHL